MKKRLAVSVLVLMTMFLCSCGSSDTPQAESTEAQQKEYVKGFIDSTINSTLKPAIQENSPEKNISTYLQAQSADSAEDSEKGPFEAIDLGNGLTIHEEDTLTVNMGAGFDPIGLIFGFTFDDHCSDVPPLDQTDDTVEEECKVSVTGDLKITIAFRGFTDPQIGLILNTEEPLTFVDTEGGPMDGAELKFENFNIWFSIVEGASEPVRELSGKIFINDLEIDLAMFDDFDIAGLFEGL